MRLIKPKNLIVSRYEKTFTVDGLQTYEKIDERTILVSVFPFRISRVPDFQVDLARVKDHWVVYSNEEIPSDQGAICELFEKYYSVVYNENTKYLGNGVGYYKSVLKLGVPPEYGV